MSKLIRFGVHGYGRQDIYKEDDGEFVLYEDYAALEARVKELQSQAEHEDNCLIDAQESMRQWRLRAELAEAKLAQLNEQEPIYQTLIFRFNFGLWQDVTEAEYYLTHPAYRRSSYAEPRPAALPPQIHTRQAIERLEKEESPGTVNVAYKWGYNQAIADAKALGCQPYRFVVKLPEIRDCCSSHIRCQVALQRFEDAIKAAGGEIAE